MTILKTKKYEGKMVQAVPPGENAIELLSETIKRPKRKFDEDIVLERIVMLNQRYWIQDKMTGKYICILSDEIINEPMEG